VLIAQWTMEGIEACIPTSTGSLPYSFHLRMLRVYERHNNGTQCPACALARHVRMPSLPMPAGARPSVGQIDFSPAKVPTEVAHGAQRAKSVDMPSTNGVTARYRITAVRRPAAHALCIVSSGEWCEKKLRRFPGAVFVRAALTQATAVPRTSLENGDRQTCTWVEGVGWRAESNPVWRVSPSLRRVGRFEPD
jgi:hypothetical protein